MSVKTKADGFPSPRWFAALAEAMREDRELGVIGHALDLDLGLSFGDDDYLLNLRRGELAGVEPVSEAERAPEFVISAPVAVWREFLKPEPPPFYNHPLAMASRVPGAALEGDLTVFVRHLRALNRVFELARTTENSRV